MDCNCIFCKIIAHEIPSDFLYEDDDVVVINDVSPQAPVHMLVLPKKHVESVAATSDADTELLGRMMRAAAKMAAARGVDQSGFRLIVNTGSDAAQSIRHLHLHVLGGKKMTEQMV